MAGALLLLLSIACHPANAADPPAGAVTVPTIPLGNLEDSSRLFGRALYLRDPGRRLTLDEALAAPWRPVTREVRNQGITDAALWLRFTLVNDTAADRAVVVAHDIANLSAFTVYALGPGGRVAETRFDPGAPFAERALAYAGPAAAVSVPAGEAREVVVTFHNDFAIPMHIGLRLWSAAGFARHAVAYAASYTFWTAGLLCAALFWCLYGVFMRQARMVSYALYMAALAATCASFSGIAYQLLYPGAPRIQALGYHWSMFLVAAAALDFARRHLELPRRRPRQDIALRAATAVLVVLMILALARPWPALEAPLTFVALTGTPIAITRLSWTAWRRAGIGHAAWMLVGWAGISVTAVLGIFGCLVNEPFTAWSQMDYIRLTFPCTVLESLLLSASLAQWLRGQEVRRVAAERAAARDTLTGLLNRRGFDDHVARLRAAGQWPGRLWLAALDIDRFKRINDEGTHVAGDAVLARLADQLRHDCRAEDVAARFGGDEFILLLGAAGEAGAVGAVERIRRRFADTPTLLDGRAIGHTLSAGLVRVDATADETALIARADAALYAAKQGGRNRVCVDPEAEAGKAETAHVGGR